MPQQFNSMNDLVEYLSTLEQRIDKLQSENADLRAEINLMSNEREKSVAQHNSRALLQTNLISRNFLARAFAVWGYFFVANLIIGIIVGLAYVCLMIVLFGSIYGNL